MAEPKVLALDFDGVICNSVYEGLYSAWRVYRDIWGGTGDGPPAGAAATYVRLRPALEIGWEFPIALRAILEGIPEGSLLQEFQTKWRSQMLEKYHLSQSDLAARFDAARDTWIQKDLSSWLGCQHLYAGVADRLKVLLKSKNQVFVITTKESRYATLIMEKNRVTFPVDRVWGKERDRPKTDLLRVLRQELRVQYGDIWFVEDRLKTLRSVQQQLDLGAVGLFLAIWGYTTLAEQAEVATDPRIRPLTLEWFCGEFSGWAESGPHQGISRGAPA
ncbi:MAG TPA: HAD family hydrolase [Candidatus Methylomirabilis sp.]|nr:HAD family hydrolase [Candidatus Methylomirabilis sp.]